jgi:hypothetical protein
MQELQQLLLLLLCHCCQQQQQQHHKCTSRPVMCPVLNLVHCACSSSRSVSHSVTQGLPGAVHDLLLFLLPGHQIWLWP